jgi:hypothetical protein
MNGTLDEISVYPANGGKKGIVYEMFLRYLEQSASAAAQGNLAS